MTPDRNYIYHCGRVKGPKRVTVCILVFALGTGAVLADVPIADDARLKPESQKADNTGQTNSSSSARSTSTGGLKCSVSRKTSADAIGRAAANNGVSAQFLENAAVVESHCNPSAKAPGSSAGGLGQFIDGTWNKYGNGGDKLNPDDNADAMARLTKDDVSGLTRQLGRTPTFEEAYLAHQQGLGGSSCLLKNPSAPTTNCVSASAVTGNGGSTNMTGGQFSSLVEGYYNTGSLSGARGAVASYNASGQMPNSGDFANGGNGTGATNPSSFPPLKTTATKAASLGDPKATSDSATGYSGDLQSTQTANSTLLQTRSTAIGGSDSAKDAMDVNSRMRADQIQLWQGGIDAVNSWNSVLTASLVQDAAIHSNTVKAIAFSGAPFSNIMPGIPSVVPSQGSGSLTACASVTFGQTCVTPAADNASNVSAFLASMAASMTPVTSAQAAPLAAPLVAIPKVPADLAAFQNASN